MSTRFEVATPGGPVWLWGRDTGRPILLVISGAFARDDFFCEIQSAFPGADVLRTHLPGNHCPPLAEATIAAFAAALDTALAARWPGRPLMAFGASVGGIVALALRSPDLRRLVVIEPPVLTDGVWPLQHFQTQTPPGAEAFVWNIFGVAPDRIEPRDHTWVLDGLAAPTLVMVGGGIPLMPPRTFARLPSLISADALQRLASHPQITVEIAPEAGHNIGHDASLRLHRAAAGWWNAAFPDAAVAV